MPIGGGPQVGWLTCEFGYCVPVDRRANHTHSADLDALLSSGMTLDL